MTRDIGHYPALIRNSEWTGLIERANAAGKAAAESAATQDISVKNNQTGQVYGPFPICGFAWVVVKPGTSAFAKWLKVHAGFSKHWEGGVSNWIGDYDQSYDLKRAHAQAFAGVLKEAGFKAYADSRLD